MTRKRNKPGPRPGSKKSSAHKRKIASSVTGKKNGRYKTGRRSYRRIAGAKSGDVVMHLDGNRNNNNLSNLKISKGKKPGTTSTSEHERSRLTVKERGAGRKKGSLNKKRSMLSVAIKDFDPFN